MKKKMGRPSKPGAVQSGELKKGLCRFSFVATKEHAEAIREGANLNGVTIKIFMSRILEKALTDGTERSPRLKQDKVKAQQKRKRAFENERRLKEFLKRKKSA
jgi:hypothetical protein